MLKLFEKRAIQQVLHTDILPKFTQRNLPHIKQIITVFIYPNSFPIINNV